MRISDWSSDVCSSDLLTPNAIGRIGWASDSRSFVYTEVNDNVRAYRARLHRLGASPDTDITLYEEHDPGFSVGVGLTQDRTHIIISNGDHDTSEVRLIPADAPETPPILISARQVKRQYSVVINRQSKRLNSSH